MTTTFHNGFVRDDTTYALGVTGLAAPELFPGWVADGDPISWSTSPSSFTLTNYTATTDGGSPALVLTDPFAGQGSALTTRSDIQNARVSVLFRAQPGSGLNIVNINLKPVARSSDANNHWRIERAFGSGGASWLSPIEKIAGSDLTLSALGGDGFLDNSDSTTHQWVVMDVFDDVQRAKTWFTNASEPGWKGQNRFRPQSGFGGTTTTTQDNTPLAGKAGVLADYGGTIYDIIVQPLARSDSNLLLNSALDPDLVDASSRPYFWFFDSGYTNQAANGICEVVTAAGPTGASIPVFRTARNTAGSNGGGPMFIQPMYVTGAADNTSYTRDRPIPTVGAAFPASFNWSIWTKGTGVANSNPGTPLLTARMVAYYYDGAGNALNVGQTDYYPPIGPNGGIGTWGWTHMTGTFPIHGFADIIRFDLSIGLHDQEATGVLLFSAPTFELP